MASKGGLLRRVFQGAKAAFPKPRSLPSRSAQILRGPRKSGARSLIASYTAQTPTSSFLSKTNLRRIHLQSTVRATTASSPSRSYHSSKRHLGHPEGNAPDPTPTAQNVYNKRFPRSLVWTADEYNYQARQARLVYQATLEGNLELLDWYHKEGTATLMTKDDSGRSILSMAVISPEMTEQRRLEVLNWAVAKLPPEAFLEHVHGNGLIHDLILAHGHVDTLKFLITGAKVPVDMLTLNGQTAAHFAAEEGVIDYLAALKENGASFEILDAQTGRTPLQWAAEARKREAADWILKEVYLYPKPLRPDLEDGALVALEIWSVFG